MSSFVIKDYHEIACTTSIIEPSKLSFRSSYWRLVLNSNDLISLFQAVEVQSTENETECPSDPYLQFLAEKKKRELAWKSNCKAKRAKVQSVIPAIMHQNDCDRRQEDPVALLRQQLDAKTEECHELMKRLESVEADNAWILSNQMEMQENVVKVMFLKVILIVSPCVPREVSYYSYASERMTSHSHRSHACST